PWSSGRVDPGWRHVADAGARYYPTLIQHLAEAGETETGYRRVGALSVSAEDAELDGVAHAVRARVAIALKRTPFKVLGRLHLQPGIASWNRSMTIWTSV